VYFNKMNIELESLKRLDLFLEFKDYFPYEARSIIEFLQNDPVIDEDKVTKYLNAGKTIISMMQWLSDVIDKQTSIGPCGYKTDGIWIWRSDLSYYVSKYHLKLNDEFLQYIKAKNYLLDSEFTELT
jgi:hypothetical protein